MRASKRNQFQDTIVAEYDDLVRRLARKFGSREFASETLHETFAQLEDVSEATVVRSTKDYLFRAAINLGKNRLRAERVRASAAEIDSLLQFADEAPDPARIAEGRSEIDALRAVLEELPERCRASFEGALVAGKPYDKIAADLGISTRTVEADVQRAVEHCARRLGRSVLRRASGRRRLA